MDYRSANLTCFGFDTMMSRVEGSICGVQSVLISTTLHVLILMIVALNSGSRIEQYHRVGYFQLVLLETEQQESSDIIELEPNHTSAQTKEPGALEPDLSSVACARAAPTINTNLMPIGDLNIMPRLRVL